MKSFNTTLIMLVMPVLNACCCPGYLNVFESSDNFVVLDKTEYRSFTENEYRILMQQRAFDSKESLLQLFHQLQTTEQSQQPIIIEKSLIKIIDKELVTYFPLKFCEYIAYNDPLLTIQLSKPVTVPVPNSMGQVSFSFSKILTMKVSQDLGRPNALIFSITSGGCRVNTSWLATKMLPIAMDMQATSISYSVDSNNKTSTMGLKQILMLDNSRIHIDKDEHSIRLDLKHEQFPNSIDIECTKKTLNMLGYHVKLTGNDSVEYGIRSSFGDSFEVAKDPKMHQKYQSQIAMFLSFKKHFTASAEINLKCDYELENGRLLFSKSINFHKFK